MSWARIDRDVQRLVARTLTHPQFEAWRLSIDGESQQRIALTLGISRRAVRDRIDHADLRLRKAGLEQDAAGRFRVHNDEEVPAC